MSDAMCDGLKILRGKKNHFPIPNHGKLKSGMEMNEIQYVGLGMAAGS